MQINNKKDKKMKSIMNFFFGAKNEYIGLSSFKKTEDKKPEIKKEVKTDFKKTSLTGIVRKAS